MTRLDILAGRRSEQFSELARFLSDRHISRELAAKVQKNAQHAVRELQRNAPEESIELLSLISEPLRIELHFELNSPMLLVHPFFRACLESNPACMNKICHYCVERMH